MASRNNVTIIPASIGMITGVPLNISSKRRVAAYARVSTDSSEQENSFDAQVDYYTRYIGERPDWEFITVYSDEGITGCNTKKREGFKTMVADALAGKFDLLVIKSVSRFARNTVDSLQTIRTLKDHNVECYFEKEQIWTFDGKGELLITIMASLAQEEARGISENVKWGKRRSFEEGKVSLPYARFLGYERGADGKPKIVEDEAKIVRLIYDLYLQGKTINGIARYLTAQGVPSPGGHEKWRVQTVNSILRQEKYAGNALLQKTFCTSYLTKNMKKNEGEIPQYFVERSHPAIIPVETFDLVQEELRKNGALGKRLRGNHIFSSMVYCGECGGIYGSKTFNSNSKYRHSAWMCNERYRVKVEVQCRTPKIRDEGLKKAFIFAFNQIISGKDDYIDAYVPIVDALIDTSKLDAEIEDLRERSTGVYAEIERITKENAHRAQSQAEYMERHEGLASRYESLKERLAAVESEKQNRFLRKQKILRFLGDLKNADGLLQDFDDGIFRSVTERMTVYSKSDVSITFRDGREVHINPGDN